MGWAKNNATGQIQWIPDAAPQPVIPVSPMQRQQQAAGLNNTQANTGQTILDTEIKKATMPAVLRKVNAEAANAENNARGATPEYLAQQRQRMQSIPFVDQQLKEFRDTYNQYFKGSGGTSRRGILAEVMPSKILGVTVNTPNAVLDNIGSRLGAAFKPLIAPGAKDADAASEYEKKVIPFLPRHGDSDQEMERKYAALYALRMQMAGGQAAPKQAPQQSNVIDFNHWGR